MLTLKKISQVPLAYMSLSRSPCTAQFNSVQTATNSLRLVTMMEKGMREGDCGKRDVGMGLWEKGRREGTVGKRMQAEG